MLSIFCPLRGRIHLFVDFIRHYRAYFPEAEIYMLEQTDSELFRRGQLMNVVFNNLMIYSDSLDNMVFADLDIRLSYFVNFENLLRLYKTVVIPYNKLSLYSYISTGKYEQINRKSYFLDTPDGGVTLFTKDIFQACNGFSNLYIGWGREDSDFIRRNTVNRVSNRFMHLEHERNEEWATAAFIKNNANFESQCLFKDDGFAQTTADFNIEKIEKNIYHCKIKNISVTDDFKYKHLIE